MDEARVVSYVVDWLKKLPETAAVREDYVIFNGGLTPDIVAFDSGGKATYLVECKGSVNVTGLVQGIGQAFEYVFQKQFNNNLKTGKVALAIPKNIEEQLKFLEIPKGVGILLVDDEGRIFTGERRKAEKEYSFELQLPDTFYIRDVEINHLASIIKIIDDISRRNQGPIRQERILKKIADKCPRIAARGFNHLITLRSLGILDYENRLSPKGLTVLKMIETSDEKFKQEMCRLFYCFIINVINAVLLIALNKRQTLDRIEFNNRELADVIYQSWGKKVRFLNDHRTVGTVIRILSELGVITKNRKLRVYKFSKLIHPDYLPWP